MGIFFDNYGMRMWVVIVLIVGGIASLFVGLGALVNHDGHVSCLRLHEQTGYETRYLGKAFGECYVKVDGQFIPADNWIVNEEK